MHLAATIVCTYDEIFASGLMHNSCLRKFGIHLFIFARSIIIRFIFTPHLQTMLRQLLAFFLLISFMAQTFSQAFIVAGYYLNTAAYAKNCENKNKPKLKCNGSCQMMKKLKQEEKKDQQNPERKITYKIITISSRSFFATVQVFLYHFNIAYFTAGTSNSIDRSCDIFHPPQTGQGNDCLS
jgi:hypothetical protein